MLTKDMWQISLDFAALTLKKHMIQDIQHLVRKCELCVFGRSNVIMDC